MCHNEQWIGGYTVLLEAAQVVYSDDCISSKRCSYSKNTTVNALVLLNVLRFLGENISPIKKQQRWF